jgi:hypothetical protein
MMVRIPCAPRLTSPTPSGKFFYTADTVAHGTLSLRRSRRTRLLESSSRARAFWARLGYRSLMFTYHSTYLPLTYNPPPPPRVV